MQASTDVAVEVVHGLMSASLLKPVEQSAHALYT